MYCGCAAQPPGWLKDKYGVDIEAEVKETIDELSIQPLPEDLRGSASTRIAMAGQALGYDWFAQPKFVNPQRSDQHAKRFNCQATCMLGCRCGAKWNAAEWVFEAVAGGAQLVQGARVEKVIIEDGHALGVEGRIGPRRFSDRADQVNISAGGIGSPRILQQSGLNQAGVAIPGQMVMVYGATGRRHRQRAPHDVVLGEPGKRLHAQHADRSVADVSPGSRSQGHPPCPALVSVAQNAGHHDQIKRRHLGRHLPGRQNPQTPYGKR